MLRLRSALYMLFLVVTVIPYAFLCMLWFPFPLPLRYRLTMGWPALAVWGARFFCGIQWQIKGRENLPDGPAIMLSKHQSAWETLFFPSHMPKEMCFVYKRELHMLPFFGWGLAMLRMIPIDRSKGKDAFEQVVRGGRARLAEGRWPILFPEGTRVPPGESVRYKLGGARLAVMTGADVIPVAHNAGECWRRKAFIKRPGMVTVSIGPVIRSEGLTAEALNEKVRTWIEAEMRRLNPERYESN